MDASSSLCSGAKLSFGRTPPLGDACRALNALAPTWGPKLSFGLVFHISMLM
jgi:hypothetical protein